MSPSALAGTCHGGRRLQGRRSGGGCPIPPKERAPSTSHGSFERRGRIPMLAKLSASCEASPPTWSKHAGASASLLEGLEELC